MYCRKFESKIIGETMIVTEVYYKQGYRDDVIPSHIKRLYWRVSDDLPVLHHGLTHLECNLISELPIDLPETLVYLECNRVGIIYELPPHLKALIAHSLLYILALHLPDCMEILHCDSIDELGIHLPSQLKSLVGRNLSKEQLPEKIPYDLKSVILRDFHTTHGLVGLFFNDWTKHIAQQARQITSSVEREHGLTSLSRN